MSDIALTGGIRSNLLSLQNTTRMIEDTQFKLSTGKKVNSALDDPISFFKAQDLNYRAGDLAARKDSIVQAQKTIEAADNAINSLLDLAEQAKAIAEQAKAKGNNDAAGRTQLQGDYEEIRAQMVNVIEDASYQGINLLQADDLEVKFDEKGDNSLTIDKLDMKELSSGTYVMNSPITAAGGAWNEASTAAVNISAAIGQLDTLTTKLRSAAATFGTDNAILDTRREFTENLVNTLESGAGELVNADMNEESANMLSLQTRQQLGTISLSIANQAEQSVLRLF
jgi:flagellin-like hook-associated protein FlgL